MSSHKQRRPQLAHSQTLSAVPDQHKQTKPRTTPAGSFFTSIFATFTPNGTTNAADATGQGLKTHRSEVELRRDYLSPEREKEICEIWDTFKRQSQEIQEDKLTSFPCITEYEYEDQDEVTA